MSIFDPFGNAAHTALSFELLGLHIETPGGVWCAGSSLRYENAFGSRG